MKYSSFPCSNFQFNQRTYQVGLAIQTYLMRLKKLHFARKCILPGKLIREYKQKWSYIMNCWQVYQPVTTFINMN